ncbi:MAG: putative transport system permease protein [Actinomycetota bacterium]|nr:putative transport system permease protein [Actinomycetota bacterium]
MRAVLYLLGTWPRRRRLALAGVALMAAVALAFVLVAGLGAHRADTAWDRLRLTARGDDLVVDVADIADARAVAARARTVPGVAQAAAMAYGYLVPEGHLEDFTGGAILTLDPIPLEDAWRPRLTAGRGADPNRVEEVVVNQRWVDVSGLGVGGQVTLTDPAGLIRQRVTIVGVAIHPNDFMLGAGAAVAYPTVAFTQRWDAELQVLFDTLGGEALGPGVFVTAADGVSAGRLAAQLTTGLEGAPAAGVTDLAPSSAPPRDTLRLQRDGYLALAGVAGLSTLAMLALVLGQATRLRPEEAVALKAVGFDAHQRRLAVLVPAATAAALAVIGAIGLTALCHGLVPTGLARRVGAGRTLGDDLGFMVRSGLGIVVVLAGLVLGLAAWSTRRRTPGPPSRPWPTPLRWPSVGAGLRAATGGVASSGRRQASAAFVAVALATLGIVGVNVVVRSRDGLRADPSRLGKFFDVYLYTYVDLATETADREALVASPAVAGVATIESFRIEVDGVGAAAIAVNGHKGAMGTTIVTGRTPGADDEVVATAGFLHTLGRGVGETVEISGPAGTRTFRVVGTATFPFVSSNGVTGEQVAVTPSAREALGIIPDGWVLTADLADRGAAARFRRGYRDLDACDTEAIVGLLGRPRLQGPTAGVSVCAPRSDQRAANLDQLGVLPGIMIGLLALLGTAGLAYLLAGSFRRARRDLSVLRVLGFTRRQAVTTVLVQAATIGLVGSVLALPLGIALGRTAWRGIAQGIGIVVVPEVSLAGSGGVVVLAVGLAGLLALPPALRCVSRPAAHWLRTE